MVRLLKGRFERPRELLVFMAVGYALFLTLAATAILLYPPENNFGFMKSSVSYVGSFDTHRNPTGYLYFCAALIVASILMVPLILYRHARMVDCLGPSLRLNVLTAVHLIGAVGVFLTGAIPDSDDVVLGSLRWDAIHDLAAKIAFLSIGAGFLIDGYEIRRQGVAARRGGKSLLDYRRLRWPYLYLLILGGCAVFFLLLWDYKCAQDPTLVHWPGSGLFAFPLWEWLLFSSLMLMHGWVAVLWIFDRGRATD